MNLSPPEVLTSTLSAYNLHPHSIIKNLAFITFFVTGLLHHAKYLWIGVALLALDLFYRSYLIWGKPVKVKDIKLLPCNVLRIEFDKENFQFEAGQYIFICLVNHKKSVCILYTFCFSII